MKHALHFCHRTKQVICLKKVQQSFLTQQLDPPPPPSQSKIPGSAPACPASVQCSLQKNDLEVNNLLSVHNRKKHQTVEIDDYQGRRIQFVFLTWGKKGYMGKQGGSSGNKG